MRSRWYARLRAWWLEWWLAAIGMMFSLALMIVGIVMLLQQSAAQKACEARGGIVEKTKGQTIWITQSCGSGCTVTVPIETQDWRCVMMPEAPQR